MNILIINGHPTTDSFNDAICEAYKKGALEKKAHVEILNIRDLEFDPNLTQGYKGEVILEDDLKRATELILKSDHMVWVHPLWWYSCPAIMKGFIDRTFLPGVTYKFEKGATFPKQLLKGKTARIICTADTPYWYYKWVMGSPATKQLKKGTLQFCGVKPVKTSFIAPIRNSTKSFRDKWLDKCYQLGLRLS